MRTFFEWFYDYEYVFKARPKQDIQKNKLCLRYTDMSGQTKLCNVVNMTSCCIALIWWHVIQGRLPSS